MVAEKQELSFGQLSHPKRAVFLPRPGLKVIFISSLFIKMFEQIYVCCVVICKMNPIVLNNLIKFCEDVTCVSHLKKQ